MKPQSSTAQLCKHRNELLCCGNQKPPQEVRLTGRVCAHQEYFPTGEGMVFISSSSEPQVFFCFRYLVILVPRMSVNSRNNNKTMSLNLWLQEILGSGSTLLYLLILQCKHICHKTDGPFPPAFSNGCLIREGIKKILKSLNKVSQPLSWTALCKGRDYWTQRVCVRGAARPH